MCFMDNKSQSSIGEDAPNKIMDGKTTKPKEKRRNNEKRKEKSRDAARCRRSRESEIFNELGETLPVCKEELDNLDKASVMRLAIATLKVENMLKLFKFDAATNDPIEDQLFNHFDENAVTKALDGFLLVLSPDGDVTYVSENIHEYIGIQQIDLIGNPIWDYTHQCDHTELREMLNSRRLQAIDSTTNLDEIKNQNNVLIRVKCTLTSRGRNVNIKSASYKVLNIVGHTVIDQKENHHQFVGIARLVPHPSNIEVPLDSKTFLSKYTLNMKFSYVDDKMLSILGYKPTDLLDKSLYESHHGADSEVLMASFKNVINKGQTETPQYRFLGRNGGYCWVVSQATLVYDKQKPQSVVCVNYVISELTNENEVYSLRQLEAFNALSPNDKLKIQERAAAANNKVIAPAVETKEETFKTENLKTEIVERYSPIEFVTQQKDVENSTTSDNPIRRVFIANPSINGTENIFLQWEMSNQPQNKLTDTQIDCQTSPTMKHLIFNTDIQQMQSAKSSTNLNTNHKRCSTLDVGTNKRLKSNAITNFDLNVLNSMNDVTQAQRSNRIQRSEVQQKSHLLQQLMAPTPQRIVRNTCPKPKSITENNITENTQWLQNVGCDRLRNQSSESVLKNLLFANGVPDVFVGEITENDCYTFEKLIKQQNEIDTNDIKNENDQKNMDSNIYGLVEDIFLVNQLSPNFDDMGDPSGLFSDDDEMKDIMSSAITEKKPFESFEKQITISVPQPPPLKAEAFTIGGGLFDGITDHTNIVPASLISPMDRTTDCASFDIPRMDTDNLMDVWIPNME